MGSKKISFDILHLALILAFVTLDPETLWGNHWHEPFEVAEMLLGSTLAYRPFYTHSGSSRSGRYVRLKGSVILDEIATFQDRPYYMSNNIAFRNIFAYYSDTPSAPPSVERNHEQRNDNISSPPEIDNTEPTDDVHDEAVSCITTHQCSETLLPVDLSPEDMDLIEILWKQDIDLGVSREAFNTHENPESEKKSPDKDLKEKKEQVKEPDVGACKLKKEYTNSSDQTDESLDYIIDSETGEALMPKSKLEAAKSTLTFEESLLSLDGFDEFTNIFENESHVNVNFTKELFLEDDELSRVFDSFEAGIFSNADKVEDSAESRMPDDSYELDLGNEMYPSMEEYWQDISTTLPLSVMNQTSAFPRPTRLFTEISDDHSGASTSSDQPRPAPYDQVFTEALVHNTVLAPRSHELTNGFANLSPLLGPTSLGCAVASSIATLTNDTDPMPDVTAPMNASFGMDISPVLPNMNQTNVHCTSETALSELLLDEELQLMDVATAPYYPEGSHRTVPFMRVFDQDPNSSDTVSSAEYDENDGAKFEELPSSCAGKDLIYGAFKYPNTPGSFNYGYQSTEASASNPNYVPGINSSFRGNYSSVQHNHTYHLPFSNGNNVPKPIARDKRRHLSCDNESYSRDEKRAKALELPITINEIINLAIDEFNEKLTKFELTEPQMTLIRDIRRRGKNKVAAQNCRKRKMDQINNLQQDLCLLHEERLQLETERNHLLQQRRNIQEKYSKLCQLVIQSASSSTSTLPEFLLSDQSTSSNNDLSAPTGPDLHETDNDIAYNQGVRSKKKIVKKS